MSRYGTGMRNCCDSVNREGYPHIVGCRHYSQPFPTVDNTMTESTDELFEMVRAAYERGYNWGQENPDSRPFLNKAAYDYADKTTSALALRTPSDGEVVAEPAAWEGYWPGAGSISSQTSLTRFRSTMEKWEKDGAEITPLYTRPHPGKE